MSRFLAYLNNYDIRPCMAQYLWVYCLLLDKLSKSYFVLNKDYIDNNNFKRWELNSNISKHISYNENISTLIPKYYSIFDKIEEIDIGTDIPSKILNKVLNENIEYYENKLSEILDKCKDIKGALLWVNNRTIEKVFSERNLPVIHNELGALRKPIYRDMCYFDFQGVNGNTEFTKRFKQFEKIADKVKLFNREELIKIVAPNNYEYLTKLSKQIPKYKCGVAMQVDLDTNLLAFNKGVLSADVINIATKMFNRVLVRNHPLSSIGCMTNKSIGRIDIDNSKNSLEFIINCENIYTINSSVGFEALLLGRSVRFFGYTPFYWLQYMDEETKLKALNFAIFSYMIPTELLYDEKYYDYRIEVGLSDEEELYNSGLRNFKI